MVSSESLFLGFSKEDLFLFFQIKFSRFLFFIYFHNLVVLFLAAITSGAYLKQCFSVTKLFPEFIQLISLTMYYDVLIHKCMKQDQSYLDKSFISEKTIWFEL